MKRDWKEEADVIEDMCRRGFTLKQVGEHYGVSKQRIYQIIEKHLPDFEKRERGVMIKARKKKEAYIAHLHLMTGRDTWIHKTDLSEAMARAFTRKKQNAKKQGREWNILPSDLIFPLICPILDIELDWFASKIQENSPSFDRIDNNRGYVKGNVLICSMRANRIKMHGTSEEHRKIADFLDSYISTVNGLGC